MIFQSACHISSDSSLKFPTVLLSMTASAIPVSILGTRFAMGYDPFWAPAAYIPVLGMLCGNTISAIVVSTTSVLRDVKYV
jgi:Uncharacterised protein family (UPF0014)